MKLPLILANYLFTNQELTLAGIGRFQLESSPGEEEYLEKNSKTPIPNITFETDISAKEDSNLVVYISSHSGKMKSLASSDLESYLEQAKEFMNIGKPFLIDGIGTLVKIRPGKFDFTQVNFIHEKIKENLTKETEQAPATVETDIDFSEIFAPKKPQTPASKKIVLLLAILAGTALAIWGGFIVYKNFIAPKKVTVSPIQTVQTPDTSITTNIDTTKKVISDTSTTTSYYKFIVEQSDSLRAFTRYNYLKKWGINIEMTTTDSITFDLYFNLPVSPADTARTRDSLQNLYGTRGKTIIIR